MRVKYIKSLSNDEFPYLEDGKIYEAEQETEFFNGEDHYCVYDEDGLDDTTPYPVSIFEKIETRLYNCPCCGNQVFEDIGEFEICHICNWEDDPLQREDPNDDMGANTLSLNQFREKWQSENKK
jgi:hypothetical protein